MKTIIITDEHGRVIATGPSSARTADGHELTFDVLVGKNEKVVVVDLPPHVMQSPTPGQFHEEIEGHLRSR